MNVFNYDSVLIELGTVTTFIIFHLLISFINFLYFLCIFINKLDDWMKMEEEYWVAGLCYNRIILKPGNKQI